MVFYWIRILFPIFLGRSSVSFNFEKFHKLMYDREAWKALGDMSREEAMLQYVTASQELDDSPAEVCRHFASQLSFLIGPNSCLLCDSVFYYCVSLY